MPLAESADKETVRQRAKRLMAELKRIAAEHRKAAAAPIAPRGSGVSNKNTKKLLDQVDY